MSLQPWFKSNNWYNFYKDNAELHISNLHLVQLQCSSFMMVGDPFDTFTNLAHEEGVFLLTVAPNWWVQQVFNLVDLVGGTFLKSTKLTVALSSFESKVAPVSIMFKFQKQDDRDDAITQHQSNNNLQCPVHQWAAKAQWIWSYPGSSSNTLINTILNRSGRVTTIMSTELLKKLQAGATAIGPAVLGFTAAEIGLLQFRVGLLWQCTWITSPYLCSCSWASSQAMLSWGIYKNRCRNLAREWARQRFHVMTFSPFLNYWWDDATVHFVSLMCFHTDFTDIPISSSNEWLILLSQRELGGGLL